MTATSLIAFKQSGTLTGVSDTNPLPVTTGAITVEQGPEAATAPTDRSGTVTLGGTAQTIMALNAARVEAWVYNAEATETMWINLTGTAAASTAGSIEIPARTGWAGKITSAISLVAATTGHKFTAGER